MFQIWHCTFSFYIIYSVVFLCWSPVYFVYFKTRPLYRCSVSNNNFVILFYDCLFVLHLSSSQSFKCVLGFRMTFVSCIVQLWKKVWKKNRFVWSISSILSTLQSFRKSQNFASLPDRQLKKTCLFEKGIAGPKKYLIKMHFFK